jgi:ATP-dependent protease HslVU (ClpYQ) ATPase subunit
MSVADAFEYLIQEEENKLLDMDQITRVAWNEPSRWELFYR